MVERSRKVKKRGFYPDTILNFIDSRGPEGATTDEIANHVASVFERNVIYGDFAHAGGYSNWSLLAALNRMSKDYTSEADQRQKHVLDKTYEYRPVGDNRYGTRVYRYRLAANFTIAKRIMPNEEATTDTEIEARALKG